MYENIFYVVFDGVAMRHFREAFGKSLIPSSQRQGKVEAGTLAEL